MEKVIYQVKKDTDNQRLEQIVTGYTEDCFAEVKRHAKGSDEICPVCGRFLEW